VEKVHEGGRPGLPSRLTGSLNLDRPSHDLGPGFKTDEGVSKI
jgi:hypothetical protein